MVKLTVSGLIKRLQKLPQDAVVYEANVMLEDKESPDFNIKLQTDSLILEG